MVGGDAGGAGGQRAVQMDVQQTAGVIPACRGSAYSPTYTPPCSRSTPHRLVSPPPPLQEHNDTLLTVLLATVTKGTAACSDIVDKCNLAFDRPSSLKGGGRKGGGGGGSMGALGPLAALSGLDRPGFL